ncbi:predicted protein [Sclerotinia sclerotiorum 1980 UF-70]|uniref:Uncharacterized protein n=1 Tax=Sclerotinia sclerotiorum (strain ATCC 18683 / 1980 / Ss-1) TaxID=665079 RepID=A7E9Y3_SCLS1|nr:predicted protein [Sclerotinia sclerotiorum 1980 UF-70]EDN99261.1 predicted protein [Sclerotinia sclerotiorum 1980 UF-70]
MCTSHGMQQTGWRQEKIRKQNVLDLLDQLEVSGIEL